MACCGGGSCFGGCGGTTYVQSASTSAAAADLVRGDREAVYDSPLANHQRIAAFWTVRLRDKLTPGVVLDPEDVTACMRLVKESRLMQTPGHHDSLIDIAGYADVEQQIHAERGQVAKPVDDERNRVIIRRFREARSAGLDKVEARIFAFNGTVIGQLRYLVASGCDPRVIARIVT